MSVLAQQGALHIILIQANAAARFPAGLIPWIKHSPSEVTHNPASKSLVKLVTRSHPTTWGSENAILKAEKQKYLENSVTTTRYISEI